MPQSCPHCRAWLPTVSEKICPKCLADLVDLSEPEDEIGDTNSPLNKAVVVGNTIQFLFSLPILLLMTAGFVVALFGSLARNNVTFTVLSALAVLGCSWFLYRYVKLFVESLRAPDK